MSRVTVLKSTYVLLFKNLLYGKQPPNNDSAAS